MESSELKELIPTYEKKSIFNRIIVFFGKKFKRKKPKENIQVSKFEEFKNQVDPQSPIYETVVKVTELCDKAIELAREKLVVESKLQVINSEVQEISYYEHLTTDDIDHLKELLDRYMSLSKDRTVMRHKIGTYDKALERMDVLEEDAKFILENVKDAEKKHRYFKHDLIHLRGEKEALSHEREDLLNAQIFFNKFSVSIVVIFGLLSTATIAFGLITGTDVFFSLAAIAFLLLIIVPGIFLLKNRITTEIILNLKKQHKVVEIFNKKSIVQAHYARFLNFIYKKYDVKNAEKLSQNIKDYHSYKHLITRFDSIGNMLRATEEQIDFFVKEYKISNTAASIEGFAKTVNIEDKRRYFLELKKEQNRLVAKNKELEQTHNDIWNDLVLLNEEDKSSEIIDRIIQRYIEEVSKLVSRIKHEDPLFPDLPQKAETPPPTPKPALNLDFDVTAD